MRRQNLVFCMCLALAPAIPAWAQTEQHDHTAKTGAIKAGTVNFETSCSPAVKADFNLAVAELHSFWFPEARALFEGILTKDPDCAIAYWGIALTHWGNPFAGQRSQQTIASGKAAIDKAQSTGRPTAREKGYIDAVAVLFSNNDVATQRSRVVAYEGATELVASQNLNDMEARIFWALAIAQTALPTDKTFAQNLRAAEILEPLYAKHPNHPGLAHYIIHAYDVPALAAKALPAARAYADIAPSVPHALHMPSHTFTRVGGWKASVETNIRSADEADKTGGGMGEGLHARDYMTYGYLQMAMDTDARAIVDHAQAVASKVPPAGSPAGGANSFALAAIPARYAMERQQWADAAKLAPSAAPNTPYTEAITYFARAIGAARSGKPDDAKADIAKLAKIHKRELDMKDAYWAEQVDVQRRVAETWVLFAEGKKDDAIKALAATADAEDATDKAAVTPGPLAPARELLGFMLLEAGRPKEALVAFDATIKKEPNRFLGLYGAGKAAEALKQTTRAKGYYKQLVAICKDAGSERPELAHARKMAN